MAQRFRRWQKWAVRFAVASGFLHGSALRAQASQEQLVWPGSIEAVQARLAAEDVEVRRRAARDLERLPPAVQRRLLPDLFADPDPEVRLAVADAALAIRLPDAGARVVKWLSDSDVRVREAAAEVLAVLRHPSGVAGLGRVLEDPEASVRAAAAAALGNSQSPDAASFLLGHLDDGDPDVRRAVIAALEELRDPRAVVPLIGRIQEQRAALRRQAAAALGTLGDARAASALIVALSDGDAAVRAAAATSLGQLRARDAVWSLSALLETETDPHVQGALVDALGAIGSDSSIDAILRSLARPRPSHQRVERALARAGEGALPGLERCIFQATARAAADICVAALGAIGGNAAAALAERALRENAVSAVGALEALGATGNDDALPTVLEYLTSTAAAERRAAIDAAGRLLEPAQRLGGAVEPVILALARSDTGREEQAALIALLGRTGSPRAASALLPFARGTDEYLRTVAVEALGQLGPAGADAVLMEALDAPAFATRWTAAVALRRVGTQASLAPLLQRLRMAIPSERVTIAVAAGGSLADDPSDADVQRVVSLVLASAGPVRDALIEGLGRVPKARGALGLAQHLPVLGKATRAKLAEVMGAHAEARGALLPLVRDASPIVRANAVWALGGIGGAEDIGLVRAAVDDRDLAVSSNAIAALALIGARVRADVSAELCAALGDARSYVQANALAGLRLTAATCEDPSRATWLLEHHPSEEVRSAAARLVREHPDWSDTAEVALARCAGRDTSGRVAAECLRSRTSAEQSTDGKAGDVEVLVVATGASAPAPAVPFGLMRSDGLIRSGTSDRRGAVWEPSAPRGVLRLVVPAVFAE